MRPYSSHNIQSIPQQIPTVFTPYQYNKPTEFKPVNIQTPNGTTNYPYTQNINDGGNKKIIVTGKLMEEKIGNN